jgi:hypothetical protein
MSKLLVGVISEFVNIVKTTSGTEPIFNKNRLRESNVTTFLIVQVVQVFT